MPFITVAIPTYQRLTMLRRAVESVFAQTFTDWEMVVSDDETPPAATWNFLEGLAASDARGKADHGRQQQLRKLFNIIGPIRRSHR
jgi:Glycosyl transferase family 2